MPHPGDATVKVTENYFYDGVRRIQTWIKRPLVQAPAPIPAGEQSGYIGFAGQASDAYVEHVYGPGYVDEFVATVAENGATQYIFQDANYNVTALISGGPPPGGSAPPAGTVLEQYQYSPYGELIVRDQLASKPTFNPIGHQGLFYQRHDAGPHLPPLDVAAVGLYYNRARFYSPSLGRFVQKDMNETALPIATALAMNADAIGVLFAPFEPRMHYGDGMNLFAYLGANPVSHRDPLGLQYDPFDEVDAFVADYWGDRLAGVSAAYDAVGATLDMGAMLGRIALSFVPAGRVALIAADVVAGDWESALLYAGFGAATALISRTMARFATTRAAIGGVPATRLKSVNLPRWRSIRISMTHVRSTHMPGGPQAGAGKTLFPAWMSEAQVARAIRQAYRGGKRIGTQSGSTATRVLVEGQAYRLTLQMWVNITTKTIETAFPKF